MMISLLYKIGKTVGKGENAGYQHFLLFLQCFPKPSSLGSLKVGLCGEELILLHVIILRFKNTERKQAFENIVGNGENNW